MWIAQNYEIFNHLYILNAFRSISVFHFLWSQNYDNRHCIQMPKTINLDVRTNKQTNTTKKSILIMWKLLAAVRKSIQKYIVIVVVVSVFYLLFHCESIVGTITFIVKSNEYNVIACRIIAINNHNATEYIVKKKREVLKVCQQNRIFVYIHLTGVT